MWRVEIVSEIWQGAEEAWGINVGGNVIKKLKEKSPNPG